ncbi:MAG: DNA repair protein RecO [Nitrospirae bacterium]|jgi:DNA repair protein RecO (recombination protein O)|nr:DNA repair protein RecO [Nitrospirota bacterium]
MLTRTEGIVLKTLPYGEADLIVSYLTPDYGLLKTFAKSPRKIKSRFGSSLEPLTYSRISFWGKEHASLPRLTQSDILHSFYLLRERMDYFFKIIEIIELTLNFIQEMDANKKIFLLFLDTLRLIEEDYIYIKKSFNKEDAFNISRIGLLVNNYKVKFLKFSGFAPKIDSCGRCGNTGNNFYISQGSVLCESCVKESSVLVSGGLSMIRLSLPVIKFYNALMTWDTRKIIRIKPSMNLLEELSNVLNLHIKYIISKPLKTRT